MLTLFLNLGLQTSVVTLNHTVVRNGDLHLGTTTLPILYISESSFKNSVKPFNLFGKTHDFILIVVDLGFEITISVSLNFLPGQFLLPVLYLIHPALESAVESIDFSAGYGDFGGEFLVDRGDLGNLGQLIIQLVTSDPPILNLSHSVLQVVFELLVLEFPLLLFFKLLAELEL